MSPDKPGPRGVGILVALEDDPWAAQIAELTASVGYTVASGPGFEDALIGSGRDVSDVSFVMVGPSVGDEAYAELAHSLKLGRRTSSLPIVLGRPSMESLLRPSTVQIMPDGAFDSPEGAAELVRAEAGRWKHEKELLARRVTLRSPSDQRSVRALRDMLEAFYREAFEDKTEGYKTLSAFREAIDNGAHHGNADSPDRFLTVTLMRDEDSLALEVKDEGSGFDHAARLRASRTGAAADAVRARLDRGEHGGLGIKLMYECADEVRFDDEGRTITLVKKRRRTGSA